MELEDLGGSRRESPTRALQPSPRETAAFVIRRAEERSVGAGFQCLEHVYIQDRLGALPNAYALARMIDTLDQVGQVYALDIAGSSGTDYAQEHVMYDVLGG